MSVVERELLEEIPVLPEEPVTREQILRDAADVIETYGWRSDEFGSPETGFCMLGAVGYAAGLFDDDFAERKFDLWWPKTAQRIILGLEVNGHICSMWNDNYCTNGAQASWVLRELAAGGDWEELARPNGALRRAQGNEQ